MDKKKNKRMFLSPPHMCGKEIEFIREAFESNYIAPLGPQVDAFEEEMKSLTGFSHALALTSGTAAMHLAVKGLGVSKGDEVIAQSLTFIGGVSPVVFEGGSLFFIDSDRISWNMDPELLMDEMKKRAKSGKLPKAVIPADIFGQCADLDRIVEVSSLYGVPVIADAAEALGATYKGRSAGKGAKAAVYSFNGNKVITTSGGGMLASDDKSLIDHARNISQQARDDEPHYEHSEIGYNYRMSNVLAAIGRGQLTVLKERVERRRGIFELYRKMLEDVSGIEFMPEADYGKSNRWLTVILIDPDKFGADRETVRKELEKNNIEARPIWKPMHMQPVFKGCGMRGGEVSEDLFRRGLCLPSGTAMTDDDVRRVGEIIADCKK
jgi:dTDP-4-amino-4,6-dideoxygalactose transaminase